MKKKINLDPNKWRHFSAEEKKKYKAAYVNTFGKVGRPPMAEIEKSKMVSMRISPEVLNQVKARAKKEGKGYQTLINEILKSALSKKAA